MQLDPAVCAWVLDWVVLALLPAPLSAPLAASWLALLEPADTLPAPMVTGTLAFTAVWSAFALDAAS